MSYIKTNLDKHIENVRDCHIRDGNQTAMAVMYNKLTAKLFRGDVIDAASSICDITKYQTFNWCCSFNPLLWAKSRYDICNQSRVEEETLRELQRNFVRLGKDSSCSFFFIQKVIVSRNILACRRVNPQWKSLFCLYFLQGPCVWLLILCVFGHVISCYSPTL